MAEGTPNIGDFLTVFTGGTNPFAGVSRTFEILKKGANDLVAAAELTRSAMENINHVATRMNRILDDIEEPIRLTVPQMTRAVRITNSLVDQMAEPIERLGPSVNLLAETLSSQALTTIPHQLGEFREALADVNRRLVPLAQLAESTATSWGMRGLAALTDAASRGTSAIVGATKPPAGPPPTASTTPARAPARKAPAKKTTAKRAAAKKTPTKKTPAKTATAKKTPAKKTTARKSPAKKATAKKSTATRSPAKRAPARTASASGT